MNKVILITGAGKGIGRSTALEFLHEQASVALCSRTKSDLDTLKKEVVDTRKVGVFAGDVSNESMVNNIVRATLRRFGRIDCLINNAGILSPKNPIYKINVKDWDAAFRINLRGPFLLMKKVLPFMMEKNSGTIINLTSGASHSPDSHWGAYGISKLALEGLTQFALAETNNRKIRIMAVNPGGTRTRMRAKAYPNEDPRKLPEPSDIARFLVWIMKNPSFDPKGEIVHYRDWKKSMQSMDQNGIGV